VVPRCDVSVVIVQVRTDLHYVVPRCDVSVVIFQVLTDLHYVVPSVEPRNQRV